jgi:hypothetical protein
MDRRAAAQNETIRWSAIIIAAGLLFIALQMIAEYWLRHEGKLHGPSLYPVPLGLLVLIVGVVLLVVAGRPQRSLPPAGENRGGGERDNVEPVPPEGAGV